MKKNQEPSGYLTACKLMLHKLTATEQLELFDLLLPTAHKKMGGNRSRYLLIERKVFESTEVQRFLAKFHPPAVEVSRQGPKPGKKKK
jgi:hypothetical protein